MKRIRVLLAEDHETVRQGLRSLLERHEDIELLEDAADGHVALARALARQPDGGVVALSRRGLTGLAAPGAIRAAARETRVRALTRHSEDAYVQELLGAGGS